MLSREAVDAPSLEVSKSGWGSEKPSLVKGELGLDDI